MGESHQGRRDRRERLAQPLWLPHARFGSSADIAFIRRNIKIGCQLICLSHLAGLAMAEIGNGILRQQSGKYNGTLIQRYNYNSGHECAFEIIAQAYRNFWNRFPILDVRVFRFFHSMGPLSF
jgi:hypothetical protein